MSANADILLFTYTLVLVGATTGLQMLYFGGVLHRPMRLGGAPIAPARLLAGGWIVSAAGVLAIAVSVVEILAGAAGADVRVFILATVAVPPIVLLANARSSARTGQGVDK
ncbi:MAG TPA: hypothetical protein VEJ20_07725 [Candidatus Eremiobacteraceae bacterium]|nr:hypothetical protein [Candidatus Eremiobacteraceae bacterium]